MSEISRKTGAVQATVTILVVAAQMILTLPSAAGAQHLPMASPEDVGMSSESLERLDAAMRRYIDADMVAGTVTLIARKGEVVHLNAQGYRYIEGDDPMDTDDIFVIMSMTKPIVSTALMMLFEEGYFLLDDPISKYMPEYDSLEVLDEVDGRVRIERGGRVARIPAARPITFRHVLSHTAGVDPNEDLLTEEEQALRGRKPTLEESLVARASLPLAFHPGDQWRYGSSTNFVALLVERISGQSLDQFLKERIFEPLDMMDTHYNVPASKVDRVAAVYSPSGPGRTIELSQRGGAPQFREPTSYFGGTAGLSSTAGDYFKFSQMILNGGELNGVRLLSPTTVNLMITNHTGDLPIYIKGPDAYGFGLGFSMVTDPDRARQAVSPGTFGWGGAWGTVFWIDPAEELVSILMVQISSYGHFTLRQDFPNLVMQAITESYHSGNQAIRSYEPIAR